MGKILKCRDVEGADCDFVARGNDEAEIFQQCAAHAQSAHPDVQMTPELLAKAKAAIKDE